MCIVHSLRVLRLPLSVLSFAVAAFAAASVQAQTDPQPAGEKIKWQKGPTRAKLGTVAEVDIPEGYQFADADDTRRTLEMMRNPTDGSELGLIAPTGEDDWFVTFEFSDVGYVKDDEKDKLDADAMLKSIRQGTEESNKLRKERGWPTLSIVGWNQPPHYDSATKNLVWAIRCKAEGVEAINYHTRRLGRLGVMSIALVADPADMATAVPEFDKLMAGFGFTTGMRYDEFRPGDKIAKYGLTALITGGAAAVAVKTGLFKYLWKLIVVGVVGVGAVLKRIFRRQ